MSSRTAKARAHAADTLNILNDDVEQGLIGLRSPLKITLSEGGRLVIQDRATGEVLIDEIASFALLGRGAMTQSTRAHMRNLIVRYPSCLEARVINTITATLPTSVYLKPTSADAARVLGALFRPLWLLAQDPAVTDQALLAAKASPGVRISASRMLGAAGALGGDAARYGAEGFKAAPVLAALTSDPSATGRTLGRGGSVKQEVRRLGGGPNVASLAAGVVARITQRNVDHLEEALAGLRSSGVEIPTKVPQQRQIVNEILAVEPLIGAATPVGFTAWYLRDRCKRVLEGHKAEIVSVGDMARWARITSGEPGGWHLKMRFEKAAIAAYELMTAADDGPAVDAELRQQFAALKTGDDWLVRAAETTAEIHGWGCQLNVCLQQGRIVADIVNHIVQNKTHLVGVFKLGAGLKPKLVSVAEVLTNGLVMQHRARANQNPPAGAEKALAAAIELNYHGDRK